MATPTYIDLKTPIMHIDCEKVFDNLDLREKLYAYYFSKASWEGSKICLFQRSYESPALFYLIQKIFTLQTIEQVKTKCLESGFTEDEWKRLIAYLAVFLQNCGNYFGYGDNKFVPQVSREKFWTFIQGSEAYKQNPQQVEEIWKSIEHEIYAYEKPYGLIGFTDDQCLSSFYTPNMSKADCEFVQEFVVSIGLWPLNTRVVKIDEDNYKVLVCSEIKEEKSYQYKGKTMSVVYGDFSSYMSKTIRYLEEAQKYAANGLQEKMIQEYIEHFRTGDVERHKESQRVWIKDKGPIIETNIGFIEVYLDPMRIRGEFSAFVAIVDKVKSAKLSTLVANAEKMIKDLPWPKAFEIDVFSKPDFTSLEMLTFACSNTPLGINLPNYNDITKNEGFKNVDLGNCYPKPTKEFIQFTHDDDVEYLIKHNDESLFLHIAIHELLGHGTGKLFVKKKDGTFNFDHENLVHPLTGGSIKTWYEEDETYNSKFGRISSAYEECRADSVALYLSLSPEILTILLPGRERDWDDIVYTMWYNLTAAGLKGLSFYSTETKQWGQSHMADRFAIVQTLLEEGNGFVKIEETEKDGKPYFYYKLDRTQIHTTGKKIVGDFLKKLQVYKSTGDVEEGIKFFGRLIKVEEPFLGYRQIVMDNKLPRRTELQDGLEIINNGQNVKCVRFEESFEGIIKSHLEHRKDSFEDIYPVWREYSDFYRLKK